MDHGVRVNLISIMGEMYGTEDFSYKRYEKQHYRRKILGRRAPHKTVFPQLQFWYFLVMYFGV